MISERDQFLGFLWIDLAGEKHGAQSEDLQKLPIRNQLKFIVSNYPAFQACKFYEVDREIQLPTRLTSHRDGHKKLLPEHLKQPQQL